MASSLSASLRPTRTRVPLIALAVVLLLGYGLFTAQRARSATTLAKTAFAVVDGSSGALIRGSHALSSSKVGNGNGFYFVTFDRHLDNCAIVATIGIDGTVSKDIGPLAQLINLHLGDTASGLSTSILVVETSNVFDLGGGRHRADSDFP